MKPTRVKLDLKGVKCPDFGLSLRSFFRSAPVDTLVLVQADVHNAQRDVVALCEFGGHKLLVQRETDDCIEFIIRRGGE